MSKIPRVIIFFIIAIVAPILVVQYVSFDRLTKQQESLEKACATKIMETPKIVEVVVTPTVAVSPTIVPKFVPKVATGGAK